MRQRIEAHVIGQSTPAAADFDIALFYAERFGERSRRLLTFARGVVDGARYCERSGDEVRDEADLIAETVLALEADRGRAQSAIEVCGEAVAIQNDRPTEGRHDPKPTIDGQHFNSAHEALIAIGRSLACAIRAWDHELGEAVQVVEPQLPLNVAKLRENLPEACAWLVEKEIAVAEALLNSLLADAQWECRQAKLAVSGGQPARRHASAIAKEEDCWEGPLSPAEWRKRFDMSETTFRRRRRDGELRTKACGSTKSLLIHRDDVRRYEKK